MYPNLYYVFKDFFGVEIEFLRFVNSFGFFVAIAFLVAAAILSRELKRKSGQGLLQPTEQKVTIGRPISITAILTNALLGFLLGFKIIGLFILGTKASQDPQAYIFSGRGSLPAGLLLAALFGWMKWREGKKQELQKPEERVIRIWPHDRVGEFTIIALIVGLLGAKLFDIFENWSDFLKRPASYIFSGGGLTFYGGLICAAIAIAWYARKHKISIRHFADAIAPALMLAYAVGRIGCQVSGDGDWGVYNAAFKLDAQGQIVPAADTSELAKTIATYPSAFARDIQEYGEVHSRYFPQPPGLSFLPTWLFAYQYPNNVNEAGIPIAGCEGRYCNQLAAPVFPTPFYEFVICSLLFLLLWSLRRRISVAGGMFCLYLILNGLERFFIEKIRVNNTISSLPFHPTQAEVISIILILSGIAGWFFLRNKYRTKAG
jgi:phosphatidylglycerol---prolipoprotein diacylglyceryl transferase